MWLPVKRVASGSCACFRVDVAYHAESERDYHGAMFGNEDVKRLVECARRALEAEDRYLVSCFRARHWRPWRGRPDGIRDNTNEHYYQFVIWRELMSSFPWRSRTEPQRYDLAFYHDETAKPVAYAEIKGWWSPSGEEELPGISRDLDKLGGSGIPGVMLILTSHRTEVAEKNFCWLADKLGVSRNDMVTASFPTSPWPGEEGDTEFAVIRFLANPKALPASP